MDRRAALDLALRRSQSTGVGLGVLASAVVALMLFTPIEEALVAWWVLR